MLFLSSKWKITVWPLLKFFTLLVSCLTTTKKPKWNKNHWNELKLSGGSCNCSHLLASVMSQTTFDEQNDQQWVRLTTVRSAPELTLVLSERWLNKDRAKLGLDLPNLPKRVLLRVVCLPKKVSYRCDSICSNHKCHQLLNGLSHIKLNTKQTWVFPLPRRSHFWPRSP